LFDKMLSGDQSVVSLEEQTDYAAAFTKVFQQPGALAPALRRPDSPLRKVHIASFELIFPTELAASSSGHMGAQNVAYTYFLRNTTPQKMKEIADLALADFSEAVRARGYEVLPPGALVNTSFKEHIDAAANVQQRERGALSKMFGNKETEADNVAVVVQATGTGVFPSQQIMSTGPFGKLAAETGAMVVGVRMRVVFSEIADVGGIAFSAVEAKPRNVVGKGTEIHIHAPDGNFWQMPLYRAVGLPHGIVKEAVRMEVTGGERAQAIATVGASALLGFFGGSGSGGLAGAVGGVNSQDAAQALGESPKFEVTAQEDYVSNVTGDLKLATRMMVEALPH